MCRAVKVLCVSTDRGSLLELKRASVSAEWELTSGAIDASDALVQLDNDRPHFLVAFGPFEELVATVRERYPAMRIVTDRNTPGADVVATSLEEVRDALLGAPRPGGPVR
ncbi:MAG: hypothetical protein WD206_02795 [Actinomycetota bacterium]